VAPFNRRRVIKCTIIDQEELFPAEVASEDCTRISSKNGRKNKNCPIVSGDHGFVQLVVNERARLKSDPVHRHGKDTAATGIVPENGIENRGREDRSRRDDPDKRCPFYPCLTVTAINTVAALIESPSKGGPTSSTERRTCPDRNLSYRVPAICTA
jgi:hypothetical protein